MDKRTKERIEKIREWWVSVGEALPEYAQDDDALLVMVLLKMEEIAEDVNAIRYGSE